ncbi:penicillin-binding protein 2 [Desulforhopalus singaporensis]|uniref:Peptidoglycan glycosyltransferase n=1 Tax=Desulforhopalus singaporensis TaxID=91360 RepID=A0A1H0R705_9BACT|nr:penicillin-binding protein 2 [Desulforhopalus singaporensis]SDP25342.1 peptidoglycan glycosyltransferase [Desulforhopalus singaporensis]
MELKLLLNDEQKIEERDDAALNLLKRRLLAAGAVVLFFFTVVVLRLWYLQISHGKDYENRAYSNRVRVTTLVPPRGHIYDRFGREIVTNRPSFNVVLTKEDSADMSDVLTRIAPVLDTDVTELWGRVREAAGAPRYMPITLKEDIDWQTLAYLENHNQEFSGVRTEVKPVRVYHYSDLAANVLGYLGAISKKELEMMDPDIYHGQDIIGKRGLEKLREADLRGEKGRRYTEVDARGFERQVMKTVEPLPGRELHLTLDVDLQQIAESYMAAGEKAGAVVALEVNSGRVLAAVSSPSIHIEDFVGGISVKKWKALLDNPKHPLINKVVQAAYPPGSTYKMITALAGLSRGVIDKDTVFYCPGHYRFGNRTYRCWKHSGHGSVNLEKAIAQSCDVYFYQVGQRVGVDGLAETANQLGLGIRSGIEMEYEKSGIIPTKEWKKKYRKSKWQEGETLSVAIGQGFNLTTPLQICSMTATIANGGTLYRPQLVERVVDPEGAMTEKFTPEIVSRLSGIDYFFSLIKQGMEEVVHGKRGTARNVRIDGLRIAGKTGTAQVVKVAQYKHLKEEDIPYKYRDHAWFTCFAPAEKPEIAVTVMVEHGLHGGSGAGPIARAVLNQYFTGRLNQIVE